MAAVNPSIAGDDRAVQAWGRFLRLAASPAVAAAVIRMIFELDVRPVLPTIRVPTLVVSRRDALFSAASGDAVAGLIPGAEFVEVPGVDYGLAVGDVDPVIDEVEAFITGTRPTHDIDRVLATVLFTDIVDSTARAAELGDRGWRAILDSHEEIARAEIQAHGGVIADFTGDGVVATFDGPARAVRAALALRDRVHDLGIAIRSGLHTGEIERRGGDIAGLGVHIAARVMALANGDEVLVSHTVKDLVAGSGLSFQDYGMRELERRSRYLADLPRGVVAGVLDPGIPVPTTGRTFSATCRVRLADVDRHGRVRLDALARFLQDVAIEDVQETGWGMPEHLWFLRRIRIDVVEPFLEDQRVDLVTWSQRAGGDRRGTALVAPGRQRRPRRGRQRLDPSRPGSAARQDRGLRDLR